MLSLSNSLKRGLEGGNNGKVRTMEEWKGVLQFTLSRGGKW